MSPFALHDHVEVHSIIHMCPRVSMRSHALITTPYALKRSHPMQKLPSVSKRPSALPQLSKPLQMYRCVPGAAFFHALNLLPRASASFRELPRFFPRFHKYSRVAGRFHKYPYATTSLKKFPQISTRFDALRCATFRHQPISSTFRPLQRASTHIQSFSKVLPLVSRRFHKIPCFYRFTRFRGHRNFTAVLTRFHGLPRDLPRYHFPCALNPDFKGLLSFTHLSLRFFTLQRTLVRFFFSSRVSERLLAL